MLGCGGSVLWCGGSLVVNDTAPGVEEEPILASHWILNLHRRAVQYTVQFTAGASIFRKNCKNTGVPLATFANCLVHGCHQIAY